MTRTASPTQPEKNHLGLFYLLTTAIALAGWISYAAQQAWNLPWHIPIEFPIFTQYSPTISALIVVAWEGGAIGVARFLKTSLNWRVDVRWYAVALLTAPAMALALVFIHTLHGAPLPNLAALQGWTARTSATVLTDPHSSVGLMNFLHQWASTGA